MEVVSILNLVSRTTKKQQQLVISKLSSWNFFMPDDLMRDQIGSYAYMQIWSYSYFHDSRTCKMYPKKHMYTNQQNQNQPAISWKKKLFCFENAYFFAIIWSEWKNVDKVFLVKQQASNWGKWRSFIGIKYSKQITLCCTNAVLLLIIVIIIDIVSTYLQNKLNGITKNFMWWVDKSLKLWGEKVIAKIAIFLSCRVW